MNATTMTSTRRILLQGYYGYGNLGDDLLLVTAYGMLREAHPDATIHVRCIAPGGGVYLAPLLGGRVPIVSTLEPIDYDLVVDGGGGVFFDFEEGPTPLRAVNAAARVAPARWLGKARRAYRTLRGRRGADGARRIGVGIGVGTFTASSKKLVRARATLGEYTQLLVRDEASQRNARELVRDVPVSVAADLVFARRFWCPPDLLDRAASTPNAPRKVAFVLRSWTHDRGAHLAPVARTVEALQRDGVDVTVFLLDPLDEKVVRPALPDAPYVIWQPDHSHDAALSKFLHALAGQDLVVSSRAHGAIVGACLGVPAICIAIEPKLRIVAGMLRRSGVAVDVTEIEKNLPGLVRERLAMATSLRADVHADRAENEAAATAIVGFLRKA